MEQLTYNRVTENLVAIAITAGGMIAAGVIDPQPLGGHSNLYQFIIDLANRFEKEVGSQVDYNDPPNFDNLRDYWLEIDAFAEEELIKRYIVE